MHNAANEEHPEGVSVRFALIGCASRHVNACSSFAAIGRSEATAYQVIEQTLITSKMEYYPTDKA